MIKEETMRIEKFNAFYDTVIEQCIKGIKENCQKEGFSDLKCLRIKANIKKSIYRNYQKKRDFIKYNYMSRKTSVALDRHKVAACMVYAILKTNPFKVNMWIPHLPEKNDSKNMYYREKP